MRALEFTDKLSFRSDYPEPRAAGSEAIVQVITAGICSTDLEIVKGYMGFRGVLGHEFVGRVVDGPPKWKGKRVVAEINCVCGKCDMCVGGLRNHCRSRTVLGIAGRDGVFADKVAVPVSTLHEVPAGVSDDAAAFAEPLAAAFQIARQVRIDAGLKVVVLGDGRLGQLAARALALRCPTLVLVGKHREKMELAEKAHIQTALADEFAARRDADVVVEATGSASGLELACKAVRPRGTIVLKSTFAANEPMNLAPLVIDEVTVVGSRCGPMAEALAALARGDVEISHLISRRLPLERAAEGFELSKRGDVVKVLVDVQG